MTSSEANGTAAESTESLSKLGPPLVNEQYFYLPATDSEKMKAKLANAINETLVIPSADELGFVLKVQWKMYVTSEYMKGRRYTDFNRRT